MSLPAFGGVPGQTVGMRSTDRNPSPPHPPPTPHLPFCFQLQALCYTRHLDQDKTDTALAHALKSCSQLQSLSIIHYTMEELVVWPRCQPSNEAVLKYAMLKVYGLRIFTGKAFPQQEPRYPWPPGSGGWIFLCGLVCPFGIAPRAICLVIGGPGFVSVVTLQRK